MRSNILSVIAVLSIPKYRFKINPDWSSFINSGKTVLILLAMQEGLILSYRQHLEEKLASNFFIKSLFFSPLGMHVIMPCFCVADNSPSLNDSFKALTTKSPICLQKHLKKICTKAVSSWTFPIFHAFQGSSCLFKCYFSFK